MTLDSIKEAVQAVQEFEEQFPSARFFPVFHENAPSEMFYFAAPDGVYIFDVRRVQEAVNVEKPRWTRISDHPHKW